MTPGAGTTALVLAALGAGMAAHVVLAADVVGEWLLWGGLAAFFTALYIGIYVWMRRPKFGEGRSSEPGAGPPPDAPAPPGRDPGDTPPVPRDAPPVPGDTPAAGDAAGHAP